MRELGKHSFAGVMAATGAAAMALLLGAEFDLYLVAGAAIAGSGVVAGLWLVGRAAKFAETSRERDSSAR